MISQFVGMLMVTSMSAFIGSVAVLGPSALPPTPNILRGIIDYGEVDGMLLLPAMIDQLCLDSAGFTALQKLDYIHYCGASLGLSTGAKLAPFVQMAPSIGSTEAGGYFVELSNNSEDWDYVSFQPYAGAEFEQRLDDLYELIFVYQPERPIMQQIFLTYPDKTRFETNDLWIEHPKRKGLWKIVGRTDDYVYLADGQGLHASSLEPEIEGHERIRAALIGGHGRPRPVLLIEFIPHAKTEANIEPDRSTLLQSLQPYLDKVNAHCHPSVQLSQDLVLFATEEKPFERTAKGSVARVQTLQLYEAEMTEMYTSACKSPFEASSGSER